MAILTCGSVILLMFAKTLYVVADFQSAGCSDEGCGIPCYIKPAEDTCHYKLTDPCESSGATNLDHQLWVLNTSLVRLQEKLIQKGVIPAGNTCPPLPNIANGGVIYTDLLLSIGVVANYVCSSGYSLHGLGRYECSVDHTWIGTDYEPMAQIPTCEASLVTCEALVPISFGHVSYTIVDSTLILPGDMATYSCEPLHTLQGVEHRVCLRNGSWSGVEPECTLPTTPTATQAGLSSSQSSPPSSSPSHDSVLDSKVLVAIAVAVPTLTLSIIAAILIVIGIIKLVRERKPTTPKNYRSVSERQEVSDNISDIDGSSENGSDDGSGAPLSKKGKKKKGRSNVITLKARQQS